VAWTKASIRDLVTDLEAVYGQPRFISRFSPLEELVSCILSQHTTDATSFPTFARLREAVPDWADLAAMRAEDLAKLIRTAGLPNQKSKAILGSLREIERRTGRFDLEVLRLMTMNDARTWLLSLPGVGPKTAAIVLCFSFGLPAIPVDTHVFRVAHRLGLIRKEIGEAKAHAVLEGRVPPELAYRFHTALIQHGRQICKAPTPKCELCPLTARCLYFKSTRKSKLRDR
jgi:endonuclease-3